MVLPKVTIQIVTWNSLKYLPECLKSIMAQTYRDWQILVVDNNSQDGTVDFLKNNFPEIGIFRNNRNLGFSRAHNQGIRLLSSPYVVVCNPDIVLDADWLEKIMAAAEDERYQNYGSFGGKLFKLKITDLEFNQWEQTDIIDSCGLQIFKNHLVTELGAGESGQAFQEIREVFGQSGALVLYRRQALEEIFLPAKNNLGGEYFDEDFFSYKEDVDLAWRLRLAGWPALLVPSAQAYHVRSLSAPSERSWLKRIKHRRRQSAVSRYYSYRNHFLLLAKNEFIGNLFKYSPAVLWQELKKFFYVLFWEQSSLLGPFSALRLWPKMIKKRKCIFKTAKIKAKDIGFWLN